MDNAWRPDTNFSFLLSDFQICHDVDAAGFRAHNRPVLNNGFHYDLSRTRHDRRLRQIHRRPEQLPPARQKGGAHRRDQENEPLLTPAKPGWGRHIGSASGKDFQAPCRSSAAVPGCGCGRHLAASSIAGRDARPTRRRDACATRFTQDYAAPTALGRIELKMPIKFSTRFGNGRIQPIANFQKP